MIVEPSHSESRGAIVAFSSLKGKPEFRRTLSALPYDKHFIVDTTKGWYTRGVESLPSFEAIVSYIKNLRTIYADKTLITVGASMGGYAAILFGNLANADLSLSFDPQTVIDQIGRDQYRDTRFRDALSSVSPIYPDVATALNGQTQNCIVFGQDVVIDAVHALRLGIAPGTHIYGVEYGNHNSASRLAYFTELDNFVEEAIAAHAEQRLDSMTALPDAIDLTPSRIGRRYDVAFRAYQMRLRREDIQSEAEQIAALAPDWAWPLFQVGIARLDKGDKSGAIEVLTRAITIRPMYAEAHLQLGIALLKSGQASASRLHLEMAAETMAGRAGSHYNLALALEQIGDRALAFASAERARAISPAWGAVAELQSRLAAKNTKKPAPFSGGGLKSPGLSHEVCGR